MTGRLILMICMVACAEDASKSPSSEGVMDIGQRTQQDVGDSRDSSSTGLEDMMQRVDVAQIPIDGAMAATDGSTSPDSAVDSTLGLDMNLVQTDTGIPIDAMGVELDQRIETDVAVAPGIEDCFPEQTNANLSASLFSAMPITQGSEVCHEAAAGELDGELAQLGFSGGAPAIIDGQEVTACVQADFGRLCGLSANVGILVSSGMIPQACDMSTDNTTQQCDVEALCGERAGASVLLFVAADPNDLRFVARVGQCGQGTALHNLTPLNAFSSVAGLSAVRYVYACRPRVACGPEAADVGVDAMYLIWR